MTMPIRELMTDSVACCSPDTPLTQVARLMMVRDCGAIPVVEESDGSRKVIGIITDRDIACRTLAMDKDPISMVAREVMSTPAVCCSADASVDECCRLMEDNLIRRIPVVDAGGTLCGIVSQADIAERAPRGVTGHVVRAVSAPTMGPSNVH
jgi:CBS domain-containing protein